MNNILTFLASERNSNVSFWISFSGLYSIFVCGFLGWNSEWFFLWVAVPTGITLVGVASYTIQRVLSGFGQEEVLNKGFINLKLNFAGFVASISLGILLVQLIQETWHKLATNMLLLSIVVSTFLVLRYFKRLRE